MGKWIWVKELKKERKTQIGRVKERMIVKEVDFSPKISTFYLEL